MSEWEPPGHGEHDGAFGASFGGSFGEGDVRWWCDRCGTSCLEATTCDCCELAELRAENEPLRLENDALRTVADQLMAENEALQDRIEKALGILNDPAWMFLNSVPAKVLSDASAALRGDA